MQKRFPAVIIVTTSYGLFVACVFMKSDFPPIKMPRLKRRSSFFCQITQSNSCGARFLSLSAPLCLSVSLVRARVGSLSSLNSCIKAKITDFSLFSGVQSKRGLPLFFPLMRLPSQLAMAVLPRWKCLPWTQA